MACPKKFSSRAFLIAMELQYGVHDYSFHGYKESMDRTDIVAIRCKRCKEIFRRNARALMRGSIDHKCE